MAKLYIYFKNGLPANVVTEEVFEGMVNAKITQRHDWELYTPEIKYILPWEIKDGLDLSKGLVTLEEMKLSYMAYVYKNVNGHQMKAAKILDMERKTLAKYLQRIDNKNWLENKEEEAI